MQDGAALAVVLQSQEFRVTGLEVERPWALVMAVELLHGELPPERQLGHPMQAPVGTVAELPLGRLNQALIQRTVVQAT